MNEEWRKEAHVLIENLTSNIASAMGGSVEVEIRHGYPLLHNNEVITRESRRMATKLLGKAYVEDMEIRMTAEDFSWFTQKIPGMMYRLGVGYSGSEEPFSLHSPQFKVNESALRTGISLMAFLAIELLKIEAVEKINT
jgi:metal-dependent amidase/aminoacylase/carboxypeptidase family protein